MNNLKVIILAAGEGKRLRPLTKNIPKCMVNFFGRSLLQRQIDVFQNRFQNFQPISNFLGVLERESTALSDKHQLY